MKSRLRPRTRKQWILLSIGGAALLFVLTTVLLAPAKQSSPAEAVTPIEQKEQMQMIEEIGKPRRERPVIAIASLNQATEVTDLMIPYGILKQAGIADVTIVAEQTKPISLYPFSKLGQGPELFKIDPQASMRAFDEQYPDGADYVVVPALLPRDDPVVVDWIKSQQHKGANIVSVCAGSLTVAATGLLDNRRSTTHWSYIDELQKAHPSTKIVPDRRYVSDKGVTTATGISASIPTMVALVEAAAGRPKAEQLARDLGVPYWDARHRSSDFSLTSEHKKTFVRNWLSFWRKETLGFKVSEGVDEMTLALTIDAYSRTALTDVKTIGDSNTIQSKHGLTIYPNTTQTSAVKQVLTIPDLDAPAQALDRALEQIAARYGRPTAEIVALTVEYPWTASAPKP